MNSKYAFPFLLLLFLLVYLIFPLHHSTLHLNNRQQTSTSCTSFFLNGREPVFPTTNQRFSLCQSYYKIIFSDQDKTGILAAEHLTSQQISQAKTIKRTTQFDYNDPVIQSYIKSGYDRGHLAPSADMPNQSAQEETFIWQNIAPERHKLNAGQWEDIEKRMRNLALKYNEVYVLTGIYDVQKKNIHEVTVPKFFYKAYFIPALHQSGVFICKNNDRTKCIEKPVSNFKNITHIDLFPNVIS